MEEMKNKKVIRLIEDIEQNGRSISVSNLKVNGLSPPKYSD